MASLEGACCVPVGRLPRAFGAETRDARDGSRVGRRDGRRARVQVGHDCAGARAHGGRAVRGRRVHAAVAPVLRGGLADGHRAQLLDGQRAGRLLGALGHWDAAVDLQWLVRQCARAGRVGRDDAAVELLVGCAESLARYRLHGDVRDRCSRNVEPVSCIRCATSERFMPSSPMNT